MGGRQGWLTIMEAFLERGNESLKVGYFKLTIACVFLNAW